MANNNLDRYTREIERIPTIPVISKEILTLLSDEDVSIKKLAQVIEKDQSMTVKILKMANSAFYGTLSRVSSIDHALVILGISEIKSILMAFSIRDFFRNAKGNSFDRNRFWKHAVICSQVAKYLARYFKIPSDDTLFLTGLIHDMGKVVFDQYFHEEFVNIVHFVNENHTTFSEAEKRVVGVTHYQVAAKLLQQWQFPQKVVMQVFYHHAPWHDKDDTVGSIIVYLANLLTKMAGYTCLVGEKKIDLSQFASSKAMRFVVKSGFDLDSSSLEKLIHQIQEFITMERDNALSIFGPEEEVPPLRPPGDLSSTARSAKDSTL
jgi:putative nucleotidyltransferase with HDIG domain